MKIPTNFKSEYVAPLGIFKNPNCEIIYGRMIRPAKRIKYTRERITTLDDDFVDIDWSRIGSKTLTILCPGLEGHSDWSYVRAIVNPLNEHQSDAVVVNNRGCSGNGSKKFFFGIGDESDLAVVVNHILEKHDYQAINIVGYSTGGNLVAKYLADQAESINPRIHKAFIVSPALDLHSTMRQFDRPRILLYNKVFLIVMRRRLWSNRKTYHRPLKFSELYNVSDSTDFYNKFCYHDTGKNFKDYLDEHSAYPHLDKIKVPLRMIYALDDYFLDTNYYPYQQALENKYLDLKVSEDGGHAGFVSFGDKYFWSEKQMIEWFNRH